MKRVDFLVLIMIGLLLSIKVTTLSSAGTSLTIKATETSKLDVSFASQAISIFSLVFYNNTIAFVVCDPNTGEMVILNSFPNIESVSAFVAAVDPEHHRYFQPVTDNSSTNRLLIIHTLTGEMLAAPPFSTNLSSLQYDLKSDYLYGTAYDFGLMSNVLIKVDPSTLEQTTIITFPEVDGILAGVSALDIEHDHYFFVGGVDGKYQIYEVNIQTGVTTTVPISYPNYIINHFEFDPSDGALISVGWFPSVDGQQLNQQLVRINVETGEIKAIANLPEIKALYQAASLFDPIENLYIFPVIDLNDIQRLFIFDVDTGELVAKPELVVVSGDSSFSSLSLQASSLFFTGQFKSFEMDRAFRVYLPLVMK
jgi:hypothetical protein